MRGRGPGDAPAVVRSIGTVRFSRPSNAPRPLTARALETAQTSPCGGVVSGSTVEEESAFSRMPRQRSTAYAGPMPNLQHHGHQTGKTMTVMFFATVWLALLLFIGYAATSAR